MAYSSTHAHSLSAVRRPEGEVRSGGSGRGAAPPLGVHPEHAAHCRVLARDCQQNLRRRDQTPPAAVPVQGKNSKSRNLSPVNHDSSLKTGGRLVYHENSTGNSFSTGCLRNSMSKCVYFVFNLLWEPTIAMRPSWSSLGFFVGVLPPRMTYAVTSLFMIDWLHKSEYSHFCWWTSKILNYRARGPQSFSGLSLDFQTRRAWV